MSLCIWLEYRVKIGNFARKEIWFQFWLSEFMECWRRHLRKFLHILKALRISQWEIPLDLEPNWSFLELRFVSHSFPTKELSKRTCNLSFIQYAIFDWKKSTFFGVNVFVWCLKTKPLYKISLCNSDALISQKPSWIKCVTPYIFM